MKKELGDTNSLYNQIVRDIWCSLQLLLRAVPQEGFFFDI
jgi:hypothetical protein